MKRYFATLLALTCLFATAFASDSFAVIKDEVLYAPHNNPPIRSASSCKLVAVDGKPIVREAVQPWSDSMPGAIVRPGKHEFLVSVRPVPAKPDVPARQQQFSSDVEAGKHYMVIETGNKIVLVEEKQ